MKSFLTQAQQTKLKHFRKSANDAISFARENNIYQYVEKGAKVIQDTQLITEDKDGLNIDTKLTKRFLLSLEQICGTFSLHMRMDSLKDGGDVYPKSRPYVNPKEFLHVEDGFEYHHLHTYIANVYFNVSYTLDELVEPNEWGIILSEFNNMLKEKNHSILCNSDIFKLTHCIQIDIEIIREKLSADKHGVYNLKFIQKVLEDLTNKYEELLVEAKIYDQLVSQVQLI